MTDQEHKYVQPEDVPTVNEFGKERKGGYTPAQVDETIQRLQGFSTDVANRYNDLLKGYVVLKENHAERGQKIEDLQKALEEAPDAKAFERRLAQLEEDHASEMEALGNSVAAQKEQLQAAFAEAVQTEAARLVPSIDTEKSKVGDIVEAITDEATVFVKQTMDRVAAVEAEARDEAEATKQAARDEADRVLASAREEATAIVVAARSEANQALETRNRAVAETKEIWDRINMFATAQSQEAQTHVSSLETSDLYQLEAPIAADSTPAIEKGTD